MASAEYSINTTNLLPGGAARDAERRVSEYSANATTLVSDGYTTRWARSRTSPAPSDIQEDDDYPDELVTAQPGMHISMLHRPSEAFLTTLIDRDHLRYADAVLNPPPESQYEEEDIEEAHGSAPVEEREDDNIEVNVWLYRYGNAERLCFQGHFSHEKLLQARDAFQDLEVTVKGVAMRSSRITMDTKLDLSYYSRYVLLCLGEWATARIRIQESFARLPSDSRTEHLVWLYDWLLLLTYTQEGQLDIALERCTSLLSRGRRAIGRGNDYKVDKLYLSLIWLKSELLLRLGTVGEAEAWRALSPDGCNYLGSIPCFPEDLYKCLDPALIDQFLKTLFKKKYSDADVASLKTMAHDYPHLLHMRFVPPENRKHAKKYGDEGVQTTPLCYIVQKNWLRDQFDLDIINEYIALGADVNALGTHGYAPLHHMALGSLTKDGVQVLIEAGAEVNVLDVRGATPLDLVQRDRPESRAAISEYLKSVGGLDGSFCSTGPLPEQLKTDIRIRQWMRYISAIWISLIKLLYLVYLIPGFIVWVLFAGMCFFFCCGYTEDDAHGPCLRDDNRTDKWWVSYNEIILPRIGTVLRNDLAWRRGLRSISLWCINIEADP